MVTRLLRWSAALALLTMAAGSAARAAQDPRPQPPFPDDPVSLVTEANKLKAQGHYDDAVVFYQKALRLDSKQFEAHLGLGMALDLQGQYEAARQELDKALEAAPPDNARDQRDQALTALAVSHAFSGDLESSERYYEKLYDYQVSTQRLDKAASTAQTIGRAYLDSGDAKQASQWYQTGQETVKKMSGLPGDQVDLWQMRWEHAQSRIAARSGNREEAETHLAAMKALIDKNGVNATQTQNFHYLVGYNAFYAGDYDSAIVALLKADPRDPAILGMLAEAYTKKGDTAAAKALAERITGSPVHSLQGAMARQDLKKINEEAAAKAKADAKADQEKIEKDKADKEQAEQDRAAKEASDAAAAKAKATKKRPQP
jgi:tetratricopeptide (TPR) repeat protein